MRLNMEEIDKLLHGIERPARYIGGEINMVRETEKTDASTRFLLFFPDLYELGMSNLGLQILYFFLNAREDTYCERAFSPWKDMAEKLTETKTPLYSLETFTPLKEFDIIGVSLQYELCYTNVLDMLALSGIPLFSRERGEEYPLIIAGGAGAYNPEPMADFIDCFYVGEGEESLSAFMDLYAEHKRFGGTKSEFLRKAATLNAIYVPSLYNVEYNDDGTLSDFIPLDGAPATVRKALVTDMDGAFFPDKLLIPLIEVVQGRVVTEIFRGCIRGCRFCQAGYVNRPQREKSVGCISDTIKRLVDTSGYEEISLMSLSTSDYTHIKELVPAILEKLEGEQNLSIALPSLRVDSFSLELFESLYGMRKTGLTFAPEAGTQRLRDVINKNLSEDEILHGVSEAYKMGFDKIKLYFMTGLPSEADEDLDGIAELCRKIHNEYYKLPYEQRKRPVSISASASCFVPKPHTPFQWEPQATSEEFSARNLRVKRAMSKKVRFTYHGEKPAVIEGALSRGDRRVANAIKAAYESGCRFDGWSECFDFDKWQNAFASAGLSLSFYNNRKRPYGELLPWDHIDVGIPKEFFIRECEAALNEETTPNCREGCAGCGVWGCAML